MAPKTEEGNGPESLRIDKYRVLVVYQTLSSLGTASHSKVTSSELPEDLWENLNPLSPTEQLMSPRDFSKMPFSSKLYNSQHFKSLKC